MKLGSIVKRGPDWRWNSQDLDDHGYPSIGTVTKIKGIWCTVKWSTGYINDYRYSNECKDLKIHIFKYRIMPP